MRLEARLLLVTTEVSPAVHADVGTDHALLPLYLLNHRLCRRVIATERSPNAFAVARRALWRRDAEVRLGDGLAPLQPDDAQSLSLCGLGGSTVVEILERHPDRVPPLVVVQANRDSHKVRRWARQAGFHVVREQMASGRWIYEVLTFERRPGEDPAYLELDEELALHFGPRLLRGEHPLLIAELKRRLAFHREHPANQDLRRVKAALRHLGEPS